MKKAFVNIIRYSKAITTVILLLFITLSSAQTDLKKFKDIIEKDSTLINGLAGYDKAVRNDILTAAAHPEVMTQLREKQQVAQASFQSIIEDLDRDTQFGIYELSRYPDLLKELTIDGKQSKKSIENIIIAYPEDIHEAALNYGRKQYKALAAIDRLNEKNNADFITIISNYDEGFQASMKRLLNTPEVLSTMADNQEFTRLAGSVYKQYPKAMEDNLEIMHNQLQDEKAKELADYEQKIKEDPQAYEEMLAAAEQFASEETNNKNITDPVTKEVEVVHVNHYSYWYGYPYWYSAPYWRPYPWYYHTGFYHGPHGVVIIGMPSYWYVGWHHRYYPNRYMHLSYHYCRHAHRHPRSHYNFNKTVNVNINNNVNINRNDLAKIDNNRGNIPKQWPNERPSTRPTTNQNKRPDAKPSTRPSNNNKATQRPSTQQAKPSKQPSTRPSTQPSQTPSTRPSTNYNNYRSNESFRQNWSQPSTPSTRPSSRPATRPSGGGGNFRRR